MLRLTLRELLLGTTLVAISIAWTLDSSAKASARRTTRDHAERLREELATAEGECRALANPERVRCWQFAHPNWALAHEPIP